MLDMPYTSKTQLSDILVTLGYLTKYFDKVIEGLWKIMEVVLDYGEKSTAFKRYNCFTYHLIDWHKGCVL